VGKSKNKVDEKSVHTAHNKRVSGSAHCIRLDPNPRYARTSDTRDPLSEMPEWKESGKNRKRYI
jgi:hypothetical protein